MANPMQGLLNDPMFSMGAGILANNTGHYGAFGPAVGKGLLSGMQQNRRQQEMLLRQKEAQRRQEWQKAQLAQMERTRITAEQARERMLRRQEIAGQLAAEIDPVKAKVLEQQLVAASDTPLQAMSTLSSVQRNRLLNSKTRQGISDNARERDRVARMQEAGRNVLGLEQTKRDLAGTGILDPNIGSTIDQARTAWYGTAEDPYGAKLAADVAERELVSKEQQAVTSAANTGGKYSGSLVPVMVDGKLQYMQPHTKNDPRLISPESIGGSYFPEAVKTTDIGGSVFRHGAKTGEQKTSITKTLPPERMQDYLADVEKDKKRIARLSALRTAEPKQRSSMETLLTKTELVTSTIEEALDKIGPFSTGWGSYLAALPETDAKRLRELFKTLEANIGFDALSEMRQNSPTGGALGNVSNIELSLLTSTMGSLDQAQRGSELKRNLRKILKIVQARPKKYSDAYNRTYRDVTDSLYSYSAPSPGVQEISSQAEYDEWAKGKPSGTEYIDTQDGETYETP